MSLCSCGPIGLIPALGALAGAAGGRRDDDKTKLPEKAWGPTPGDTQWDVPVTTNLCWAYAGGATFYDVYFGTGAFAVGNADHTSSEFLGSFAEESVDPQPGGNLFYNTTYYWRVDSVNAAGTTKGDVWNFRTENTPVVAPDKVTGPDPASGEVDVPVDRILCWEAARGAQSYDIYFDTDPVAVQNATTADPEFKGNKTELKHNPGPLAYDTDYYWRIDSVNSFGTTKGDRWSFKTALAPPAAEFSASPMAGGAPLMVVFTDLSTGSITSWSWNFGDGGTSTVPNPSYTYNNPGDYTVSLTVSGPSGSDIETKPDYITVTPGGSIIYVDDVSGNDANDGFSWTDAVRTIQRGLDGGNNGWTVLVADGTYIGGNNRDLNFKGKSIHLRSAKGAAKCIIDCEGSGRGFYFYNGETNAAIVEGFTIQNGNTGSGHGGGIYCYNYSDPTIINCIITNNMTTAGGGGYGGGIYCEGSPRIINCIITDNTGECGGGIGSGYGVHPVVTNCTIANNSSNGDGGGIHIYQAGITLNNTIIWGNTAPGSGNQIYTGDVTASVTLNYCDYADGAGDVEGAGSVTDPDNSCIHLDPVFVDITAQDYHLQAGSPCIDRGDNSLVPPGVMTDLDGDLRIRNAIVDIGCYEGGWLIVDQTVGPFTTIQSAIDASVDSNIVLVKDGTYKGAGNKDLDFGGRLIHLKSAGGATNCIIDCEDSGRGFFFYSGETNNAIVEGFTIQNGRVVDENGGGILCENSSSPTIQKCIIVNCQAQRLTVSGSGAGIHCWTSNPTIIDCTIEDNLADYCGGGICCAGSSPIITNCIIRCNSGDNGGGLQCASVSNPVITNCVIADNTATNSAGGGLYVWNLCNPIISNCTIAGNTTSTNGGGIYCYNSNIVLNNIILWSNAATASGDQIYTSDAGSSVSLSYSCYGNNVNDVEGSGTVTPSNCSTLAPEFVDATAFDYHLQGTSPCIDKGNNSYIIGVNTDLDGNPRIINGVVDMGAYEYEP